MKKERLKTIALTLLVICSIILTVNKWFSKKLWPDGYNFFSNLTSYFSFGKEPEKKSYYLSKENISNPSKIIVSNNELRGIYTHTSENYNLMLTSVKNMLKSGLGAKSYEESSLEQWKDALKGSSIYITYPVPYDAITFSAIMDVDITGLGNFLMKEFIILSGDNITGKAHMLIRDASSDKFADVTLSGDPVEIDNLIESYAVSSVGEYAYSFELNFDTKSSTVEQKIVIEPQVVLSLSPVTQPSVTKINYLENIHQNKTLYTKILKDFGFNTTNMRKYVNVDSSIVFVENYGSITMYPDGYLEFSSLDDSMGIALKTSSNATSYDTFIECIEFINNVWDTACGDCNMNINLSSFSKEENGFKLTIDYYADGMIVASQSEESSAHKKLNHAIEITVKNSKIVSYRQLLNGYVSNNDSIECPGVIEALDKLMEGDSIKSDTITDLYLAYSADAGEDNLCTPHWVARTAENETKIIKDQ